jgi:hypothetical protein
VEIKQEKMDAKVNANQEKMDASHEKLKPR